MKHAAVWISGASTVLLFLGLAWWLAPLKPSALALQFAFDAKTFGTIIHAWSPAQLERYRAHLPVDYLLLAGYGAFGYRLATRTAVFAQYGAMARRAVRWMLPLAAASDAVENALHWWLTEVPRFGLVLPYALSGACSVAKWLLLLAFALAVMHASATAND